MTAPLKFSMSDSLAPFKSFVSNEVV